MKTAKTLLLTVMAAGSLVACGSALAQDASTNAPEATPSTNAPPHPMFRGPSMERIAQALNLTDSQKTQVEPILQAQFQKIRDVRNDDSLSSDDKRAKIKTIHEDTATQLQAILTPEQFQKWQSMSQRPHHMAPPPADTNTNTPPPAAQSAQ